MTTTDPLDVLPERQTELNQIVAALFDEQPFPRTALGDAVHNLRGRAETAERALAAERGKADALRAAMRALAEELRRDAEAEARQPDGAAFSAGLTYAAARLRAIADGQR